MVIGPAAQIVAFGLFALIAIAGALGMATTMSMFRSGLFLMASFMGVAGLFILLSADLIGMLQVMMYLGGMLVMIVFMLLFSTDPGGERMTSMMKLPLVERFFSLGLAREDLKMKHGGGEHEGHGGMGSMSMDQMSMTTPIKKVAAVVGALAAALFIALLIARPAWPVAPFEPDPRSAERIGDLLMGKYMIAFEGAGLLILLGIFGAVYASRPGLHPDPADREHLRAAVDAPPAPIGSNPPGGRDP